MFIYLSKKIAIPNNTRVNCLAWHHNQGWIAVGGDDGLLKVLKLEGSNSVGKENLQSLGQVSAANVNLAMNQSLQGHNGKIEAITWNEQYEKLTSSDESGLIIVWMLYKGAWCEEMINNRNKSIVKGMSWNDTGLKICIVYEDGAVIVGSVDGNRIWGKEFKKTPLIAVQWTGDTQNLLFAIKGRQVHLYDSEGNFMNKINVLSDTNEETGEIVALKYYLKKCEVEITQPGQRPLVICFELGYLQFMKCCTDDKPIITNAKMNIVCCEWNENGSVLAVAGNMKLAGEVKHSNVVQFFSCTGEHVRSLKLPGTELTSCTWGPGSLRIALSIDSFIYFANIRPYYTWTYFSNTLVFAANMGLLFWDVTSNASYIKSVPNLVSLTSNDQLCAILSRDGNQTRISLCNELSTNLDTHLIFIEAYYIDMNKKHVMIASKQSFILWQYATSVSYFSGVNQKKERVYHIDDTPAGLKKTTDDVLHEPQLTKERPTLDPICCLTCSDRFLIIGRVSGTLQRYTLPDVTLVQRNSNILTCRPNYLALNCDSTKLGIIDATGVFIILDIHSGETLTERRDVWGMKWAVDNPSLIAIMEKTRMYVLKNGEPEDPIVSSAYICNFKDLEIKTALLDEIKQMTDSTVSTTLMEPVSQFVSDLHVKALRDTQQLLDSVGLNEAFLFVEQNSHPRLWKLLAEKSLELLDFNFAEQAMVKYQDYTGLQLLKTLQNLPNDTLKQAYIASHQNKFHEAEKYYLQADRRDLAISMREKIEDYSKVLNLLKIGRSASDAEVNEIFRSIGDSYAEKCQWIQAKEYYEKCHYYDRLIDCYYRLNDFEALEVCVQKLPEHSSLLKSIGDMFAKTGLCEQALFAYNKSGNTAKALEVCVELNQWHLAMEYANEHNLMHHVADLLEQYTSSLLMQGLRLDVVQLFKAAEKRESGAKLMMDLAEEEEKRNGKPKRLKQLYLLTALLIEEFADHSGLGAKAWHKTEAYHFIMLAHRQLLFDKPEWALSSSLILRNYEDVLSNELIYSLIALSSIQSRAFGTASKAFMKLESINEKYEKIAIDLFTKHPPQDSRSHIIPCSNCNAEIPLWYQKCMRCNTSVVTCVATGRPIVNLVNAWRCNVCKQMLHTKLISCPLCYSAN